MATLTILNNKIKQPYKSKENILTIHSPKSCVIETANTISIDTGIIINLPKKSTAHLTTKFRGQKIIEIQGPKKERLWLTLFNKFHFEKHQINKGEIIGYLLLSPCDLSVKYETPKKKNANKKTRKLLNNYLPKDFSKNWMAYWKKKGKLTKRQTGGFLNCYDFAYAGRDTVNQVDKIAPNTIKNASDNINQIAKERIDQAIKTGSSEIERIAPKIIWGAIEDVYKAPFRLLGNLGKKQFQKIKRQIFNR